MVVILSSYVAITLGVLLLMGGYALHRRESEYSKLVLLAGGILLAIGVAGILWVLMAFD